MQLIKQLNQIADTISRRLDIIKNEEATKTSLILPFISALGYNIFDPKEVSPEEDCDISGKGDKVDYAIKKDGQTIMVLECKAHNQRLDSHEPQLRKYYVATDAKFGILTNGIQYRFYTDLEKSNIMDLEPFLSIDVRELSSSDIEAIQLFSKTSFNTQLIINLATEVRTNRLVEEALSKELSEPSPDFIKYFIKKTNGSYTQKSILMYTSAITKATQNLLNIKGLDLPQHQKNERTETISDEKADAFNIIRGIVLKTSKHHLEHTRASRYSIVHLPDNKDNWICRLFIGPCSRYIIFANGQRADIENNEAIYELKDAIISSLEYRLNLIRP